MNVCNTRLAATAMTALLGLLVAGGPAFAEDIAVGNYGSSANGMPFAVALANGYF
jgi:NitT/TauT family transport system substrate-binding protein